MLLELWQVWSCDIPEEPVTVAGHPLSEEPFHNVQCEFNLMQCHSLSCPVAGHWRSTSPPPLSLHWRRSHEVTLQPSLSWANQAISDLLRPYTILAASPRCTLTVWCSSDTEAPKTAHRTWLGPHQRIAEQDNHLPWAADDAVLECKCTPAYSWPFLLTHIQFSINPGLRVSFCGAAVHPFVPCFMHTSRVTPPYMENQLTVVQLSSLSTCLCKASLPSRNLSVFPASKLGLFWMCCWWWCDWCSSWQSTITQMCSHLPPPQGAREENEEENKK